MANLLNNRFMTNTYNSMFPGLNKTNYDKVIAYGNSLGLEDEEEKKRAENSYYRKNVSKMVNDQILDERDDEINQQAYQAASINSKDADIDLRTTELSQTLKRKYDLDATANDAELVEKFISGLTPEGKSLVGKYLAGESDEFLYVTGLAERPQEEKKKETGWQKAGDFATGVAQSPGKWGYNIIGQWMDRAGKAVADKLQGTDLANWIQQSAIDMFGEEEVKKYQEEKAKQLEEGTAFKGREAADIRTPILGEERANSGWTKGGEIVGDIASGIALTAPIAAATAPMYATSTIGGAATLGSLEGILDAALVKYGSTGESPTAGDLAMGGITGAAGGLLSRYLQNLPKSKADSFRKEAETHINKSIKPTVKGKESQADYNKFIDDTLDVTNFMNKNKGLLQYTDDAGEKVTGKLPTNLRETSESLSNLKKVLYDTYNDIALKAGDKGARVDLNNAFNQLDDLERNVSQNIGNPQTKSVIDNFKKVLLEYTDDAGTISIDDAQKITQEYNKQLTSFFKNISNSSDDVSKNAIVAKLNKWVKDAIDDSITNTLDDGIKGAGTNTAYYKDLKGMYSKIKTIEDEIAKRALVDARKNTKGLTTSLLDAFAGGELTEALLTANPAQLGKSTVLKAISKYYNYINDPNIQIDKLFKLVENTSNPSNQGILNTVVNTVKDTARAGINNLDKVVKPSSIATTSEVLTND